ncbi:MAG: MBL fold metallo-hydrolase [Propionibacteriaceae bacterium]|jgi:L-ascorbate metabolism protein UlaG (beta-lactamase superfamily)|nr:MBL fold metallo-hydrolase [Propionibacteriaceae bacterium]
MIVTHLGHSAVLVETGDRRLLIDPGDLSQAWHGLSELDAVIVTHQHPDHADPVHLPGLLAANPRAQVLVEPSSSELSGLPRARPLEAGQSVDLGSVRIRAVGGRHAVIHRDIPRIGNVGVVLEAAGEPRFFHPGDALEAVPAGVDLVGLPAHGPWCAMKEIIDFARALAAPRGFLIHDGLINQRGWRLSFDRLGQMSGTELVDLRSGQPWTVA